VDWKAILIPLIPLAIWIIVAIFRAREEAKEDQEQQSDDRPKPRTQQPARHTLSDRERFEQQAQARRTVSRANREQPAPQPRVEDLPRAKPVEATTPAMLLATPLPPSAEPAPAPIPQAKSKTAVLPLGRHIKAMLRDKDALKAAVVLQEILGPPVCRRRGS
jgi:hypothetical protein